MPSDLQREEQEAQSLEQSTVVRRGHVVCLPHLRPTLGPMPIPALRGGPGTECGMPVSDFPGEIVGLVRVCCTLYNGVLVVCMAIR